MSNVLNISDYRPHLTGPAKCLHCGYEWQAVAPIPAPHAFECPECGLMRGLLVCLIEENEGIERFSCNNCQGQLFNIRKDFVRCAMCGQIHNFDTVFK